MESVSVPPLMGCKSAHVSCAADFFTPLFHSKTSTFLSQIVSREKQSPTGYFFAFIAQNDADSCFLKPVNRESKPVSREIVFISREMEIISREMKTISREMKTISREMKTISREMKLFFEK
jgi:hypothetical protein